MRQVRLFDFARAIDAGAQFVDPFSVEVEADRRSAGSRKRHRHGQADIAKPDHGNLALMRHHAAINPVGCTSGRSPPGYRVSFEDSLEPRGNKIAIVRRAGNSAIVSITLARGLMLRKIFVVALLLRWSYALLMFALMGDAGLQSVDSFTYLSNGHEFAAQIVSGSLSGWQWLGPLKYTMPLSQWLFGLCCHGVRLVGRPRLCHAARHLRRGHLSPRLRHRADTEQNLRGSRRHRGGA